MPQNPTKMITWKQALMRAGFRAGWEDVAAGRPHDPRWLDGAVNDAWAYARGRALALDILCSTKIERLPPIKNGARLNNDAIRAVNLLFAHLDATGAPSPLC